MTYPTIEWREDNLVEGLKTLEEYAISYAVQYKEYYNNNSAYKRTLAKALRIISILGGSAAGLLPILSQISSNNKTSYIDPAWATVAVSIAITAIGLDRFFGFSSGWIRFVTTVIKIQSKIEQLRLSVESEKFTWQGSKPTFDKAKVTLITIVNFINEISEIVSDETNTWIVEFQNVLQKFNEEMNVKADVVKLGAIKVAIENSDKCKDGLMIHLEGQQPISFKGTSYSFTNLYPKIYRIAVIGDHLEETNKEQKKTELRDEALINVTPGSINDIVLRLK